MKSKNTATQKALYTWYQKNKRDLPWRKTHDPYAIWISEIMLQQTRVDTVIDYWHRFLSTFPTVFDLANASEEGVLQIWQGLGYYRRAKLLHKASKQIVKTYNGKLPSTKQELIKLSGFGEYTSGAVASIAFGQKVPCVDGNVIRVLSRVYATHKDVTPFANDLANHSDPSSINQAIMEIGALICVPKNPKCLICPLRNTCEAYQTQNISLFPAPRKKAKVKNIYACALVLQNPKTKKYLLCKRPDQGRWAGMWEFPYFEGKKTKNQTKEFLQSEFPKVQKLQKTGTISHQLTHQNIVVDVFVGYQATSKARTPVEQWVVDLDSYPTSVLTKKILGASLPHL